MSNEYDWGYKKAQKECEVLINGLKTTIERLEAQGMRNQELIKELEARIADLECNYSD